jgi:hypothetical protein
MNPTIKQAVAIPDEEYSKLRLCAKANGKRGYLIKDKKGVMHRFFMKDNILYSEKKVDDALQEFEVMSMTEALEKQKEMNERDPNAQFKAHTMQRMRQDHPNMSDEDLEANADIVVEANESIKRLISKGIPAETAHKIITGLLHSEDLKEHIIDELKKKEAETIVENKDD